MAKLDKYTHITDRYRTRNKWVERSVFLEGQLSEVQSQSLETYLDQPGFNGLKYRYFNTPGIHEGQKNLMDMPITQVFDYAYTLMEPLFTDFTEVNEDEDFNEISDQFYYQLFVQEYIYVTYNVFEDEGSFEINLQDEKNRRLYEAVKAKGGFDLWVKLDEDVYSTNVEFMHIDTALVIKAPKGREEMAWCRGGATRKNNLSNGLNIAAIDMALTQYHDKCIRVCGKKIIVETRGNSKEHRELLEEQLNSFNSYIQKEQVSNMDVEPFLGMDGSDLEAIKDSIFYHLDRLKYEYGRVANTNPKGERMTSGENYKDITAIANRQKQTLERLNHFASQCRKLGGKDLVFAVSGIPEKEALYTVSHLAQTPNMEKEMMGQIEGTQPRPPIGQKIGKRSNKSNKGGSWSH